MPRVLEEVTGPEMDQNHTARRVDDWASRIDQLYAQIESWLPDGWTADRNDTVRMHEELMQKFGIAPRNLPVLRLSYQSKPSARIEPRGLWIIGANGRLDLFRGNSHYIIVDTAENFGPPDWHIAALSDRRNLKKLSRETFIAVL
jgi:hypothetical protein